MKKFLIFIFCILFFWSQNAFAAGKSLDDALSLAPDAFAEYVIPLKFRNVFISLFWAKTYDNIQKKKENNFIVKNSKKLWWISASRFVKMPNNCEEWKIATSIDANGNILCSAVTPVQSTTITVENGIWTLDNKKILKKWDQFLLTKSHFIETKSNQILELSFVDQSIIRLDENTKIHLNPKNPTSENRTIAQVVFGNGLLWGRVFSDGWPEFRKWEIIAGVRGTSLMLTNDDIFVLQSQKTHNALQIKYGPNGDSKDLWKCSSLNGVLRSNNKYCIPTGIVGIEDARKIIEKNNIRDYAYIEGKKNSNQANDIMLAEKNIIAPQGVEKNSQFCPAGETYWKPVADLIAKYPDLLEPDNDKDMLNAVCQDNEVIGMIVVDGTDAPKLYVERNNFWWSNLNNQVIDNNVLHNAYVLSKNEVSPKYISLLWKGSTIYNNDMIFHNNDRRRVDITWNQQQWKNDTIKFIITTRHDLKGIIIITAQ